MRSLTLARALKRRGATPRFVVTAPGDDLLRRFAGAEFDVIRLPSVGDLPATVARLRPDGLALDNYGLDFMVEAKLNRHVKALLVIDDLANRAHSAPLIVDPSYGRNPQDYEVLAPNAEILAGPSFALVAQSFGDARPDDASGALRPVDRLFVSFGLSDIGGIAHRAVKMLSVLAPSARLEVALAADAPSVRLLAEEAARDARIRLHIDARNVAELMAGCDICVGAGGSSVWERATLGKPSLAVIVAENQRALIERLTADGLCVSADLSALNFERQFADAFQRLADPEQRRAMAEASLRLCDGQGAARLADAFIALIRR
jgi:UDP-2,4-diacetamido-2,4,6-trideoxy-beta-L-altropyranose hydrolase